MDPTRNSHQGLLAIGVAVAAAALFIRLSPRVDPDVVARDAVSEVTAVEASRLFLQESGFSTDDLVADARFVRRTSLLRSLQRAIGRTETVRLLSHPGPNQWPAYGWEVRWGPKREEDEGGEALQGGFDVSVTASGEVFAFRNQNPVGLFGRRDSLALAAGWRASADGDRTAAPALAGADAGGWAGAQRRTQTSRSGTRPADAESDAPSLSGGRAEGQPMPFSLPPPIRAAGIGAMGRYHLGRTGIDANHLVVDSIEVQPDRRGLFSVRLSSPTYSYGHRLEVDVEVTGMGMLVNLQPRLVPEVPEPEPPWWNRMEPIKLLPILGYALAILIFAVLFFRRLGARTIDTSAASRDAIALGLAGAIGLLVISMGSVDMQADQAWMPWLMVGVGALFGGLGMGVITFLVSGAADAIGREAFPERLRTLTLVRQTHFLTQPVGLALVRGLALGLLLAAGWAALWLAAPHLQVAEGEVIYARSAAMSPFVASFSMTVWSGFLRLSAVLLGIGALLRRRGVPALVSAAVMVSCLTLFGVNPVYLQPDLGSLVSGAVVSAALVLAFLRFDFLTALIGLAVFHATWLSGLYWVDVTGSLTSDGYVATAALGGLALIGFIALRSKRTGEDLPEYVPEYIAEMARNERVNRELEIARHVQKTFLPREMPHVNGLDMAALCLAANEVGGDYYDFVPLSGRRLALVVGDVSGKGFQAAFYMTLVKGFFRTLCREEDSPAVVLRRMNRLFWESAERGTFISLIYGILDLDRCTFVFSRAGHNPVILKRSPSQVAELIRPAGLALGLVPDERFDDSIQECTLDVRTGDILVFHTDGFTEARNGRNDLYGESRLADVVANAGSLPADEIMRRVTDDVLAFVGSAGQADDMTILVMKVVPVHPQDGVPATGTPEPEQDRP